MTSTDHQAPGESADAQASGMERGAAAQAPAVTGNDPLGQPPQASDQPAAAVVSERCMRLLEPDFTKVCQNDATAGYRVILRPAPAVQKRYGRSSLLTFIVDLPVCAVCWPKATVFDIVDQRLRQTIGREAQRLNQGFLVDWKETTLEPLTFDAPEYIALRQHMASAHPEISQPAPPGPQQGAAGGE